MSCASEALHQRPILGASEKERRRRFHHCRAVDFTAVHQDAKRLEDRRLEAERDGVELREQEGPQSNQEPLRPLQRAHGRIEERLARLFGGEVEQ